MALSRAPRTVRGAYRPVATGDERVRLLPIAAAIVEVLSRAPGMSVRKLRLGVRATLGRCTDGDTDAALTLLGTAVTRIPGGRRAHQLTLAREEVPTDVQALVAHAP